MGGAHRLVEFAPNSDHPPVLTCIPQSIFSWSFHILGAQVEPAELAFNFFTEQGSVVWGETEFSVVKHGPLSGRWTLEDDGIAVAEAHKPSVLFRSFDLSFGDLRLKLQAQLPVGRSYEFLLEGEVVGTIRPENVLTRQASIECSPDIPELAQIFGFWLAVMSWRRSSRANS